MPEREKELIWHDLKQHFTLLEGSEELVKKWTLKRMATQFQTVKKNLTNTYIKQGKTSKFTREFAKLKDHWDSFLEYKCSELGIQWVRRNKENASKKKTSPHSSARWLKSRNPEMGEDGARFAC